MKKPVEFLPEVQLPITLSLEDIKADMYTFSKNFPKDQIPHVMEGGEINDMIHNYRRPKTT